MKRFMLATMAIISYCFATAQLQTRWSKEVSPFNALKEYPRPQMIRNEWTNLNGLWQYAITGKDATTITNYDGEILVPYPIESALLVVSHQPKIISHLFSL